jgi:hypothetical protein
MDKIITAHDYSKEEGADGSVKGRIKNFQVGWRNRGAIVQIDEAVEGKPVYAEINQGAWIAFCECNGAEFVSPAEPVFFCCSCVNRANQSKLRPVIFPDNVAEIEAEVLKRPVNDVRGITDKDRAFLASPLVTFKDAQGGEHPATRSWVPGETVDDLKKQNKMINDELKKAGK